MPKTSEPFAKVRPHAVDAVLLTLHGKAKNGTENLLDPHGWVAHLRSCLSEFRRTTTKEQTVTREVYTIAQFCECFGIGRTTAFREIKEGRLGKRKIGTRTVIPRADADQWFSGLPVR